MSAGELAHFAALVRRYREAAGYSSARAFYDAQGGREALGAGYKTYANLERGVSVPQPFLVEKLVAAFRLALSPERSREFALAYLRVLLGFDEMLEFAVQALAGDARPVASASLSDEPRPLSARQAKAVRDPVAHAVLCALSQDRGRWSAGDLARALALEEAAVARALKALEREGLASRDAAGRHAWAHPGNTFELPADARPEWPGGGEVLLDHPVLVRARESELSGYLPFLAQSLAAAELQRADKKEADSGLFSVEASVTHLLSF